MAIPQQDAKYDQGMAWRLVRAQVHHDCSLGRGRDVGPLGERDWCWRNMWDPRFYTAGPPRALAAPQVRLCYEAVIGCKQMYALKITPPTRFWLRGFNFVSGFMMMIMMMGLDAWGIGTLTLVFDVWYNDKRTFFFFRKRIKYWNHFHCFQLLYRTSSKKDTGLKT